MDHAKRSKLLERWTIRFEQYGDTFAAILLGAPMIATIDPLNVQTMLGSNFKDFGVQPLRRSTTVPFLGEGVFTMGGPFWQHSRSLMRPTFTRTNVANLPAFEKNLQKFFKLLPEDGSTYFDFQKSFNFSTLSTTENWPSCIVTRNNYDSIKVAHAFADIYVDKAIRYRTDGLSKEEPTEKDRSGYKYVRLHDMAMQTDNRSELRSQILHVFLAGHESSAITIGNALLQLS
ncbi:uncharacterized protein EAF02_008151 [Botrytis sinoallii]|uniref:uncharacterized protein n=1 Tax=Botrytis sinoallii TaxID=1463999 RepID=UPI001902424D|nr:uncharacterized protein EAF02_008151 [Botrytis sinoallii]KAF7876931.1 hypothetical protein EAF02_008151 [Botrytis sinoallii]